MAIALDLVGIAVKDMADSLRFYRALGLPIPEGQDNDAHVELEAPGVRMAWDTVELLEQVYGTWDRKPSGHRIELAFKCANRDDVDVCYRRVMEQGYHGYKEPWDAFWGQRYAILRDPDGNLISLFA
jgi:catechol 2,3-dioxygenase-like lactoylglutathione lyase family enzyme